MLDKYRKELEKIDARLLQVLHERFELSKKVARYKKRYGIRLYQQKRERELYIQYAVRAKQLQLDPHFVQELFGVIFAASRRVQAHLKQNKRD